MVFSIWLLAFSCFEARLRAKSQGPNTKYQIPQNQCEPTVDTFCAKQKDLVCSLALTELMFPAGHLTRRPDFTRLVPEAKLNTESFSDFWVDRHCLLLLHPLQKRETVTFRQASFTPLSPLLPVPHSQPSFPIIPGRQLRHGARRRNGQ